MKQGQAYVFPATKTFDNAYILRSPILKVRPINLLASQKDRFRNLASRNHSSLTALFWGRASVRGKAEIHYYVDHLYAMIAPLPTQHLLGVAKKDKMTGVRYGGYTSLQIIRLFDDVFTA